MCVKICFAGRSESWPVSRPQAASCPRAAAERHELPAPQQENGPFLDAPGLFGCFYRQPCRRAQQEAFAQVRQRAVCTVRRAVWHADRCAKLHQCLVESSWCGFRDQRCDLLPQRRAHLGVTDRAAVVPEPCHDPQDIAVDCRDALSESNRRNRPRCVIADPGQFAQLCGTGRELHAVFLADYNRCAVQVARSAVIDQHFPKF